MKEVLSWILLAFVFCFLLWLGAYNKGHIDGYNVGVHDGWWRGIDGGSMYGSMEGVDK